MQAAWLAAIAGATLAVAWPAAPVSPPAARVLALVGGTLIDGTGRAPVADAVVLIRGNRIAAIGSRTRVRVPEGASVLDTTGQFIVPGLIESHFHYGPWMPGALFLGFGITTAVHFGDRIPDAEPPPNGIRTWPRVFFSGEALASPRRTTRLGKVNEPGDVTTPDQARARVSQLGRSGARLITVSENLDRPLLAATTAAAHRLGLPVIGHHVDAVEAVEAGIDALEHLTGLAFASITDAQVIARLTELQAQDPGTHLVSLPSSNPEYYMDRDRLRALTSMLIKRRVYVNPTLTTRWGGVHPRSEEFGRQFRAMADHPRWSAVPEGVRQRWRLPRRVPGLDDPVRREQHEAAYRKVQAFLKEFVDGGGKLLSGSDVSATSVPGVRQHQELALLADAGLTPMQVLAAATREPARFLRLDRDLGTVEPGKLADILVVKANPLERVENLARIAHVIVDGRTVDLDFAADRIMLPAASH